MKTLDEKIKKVLEEFDGKFNHFNSSVSGKQICDKYCDKAYDLEDVKSFLRSSIRKVVEESLKGVEKTIKKEKPIKRGHWIIYYDWISKEHLLKRLYQNHIQRTMKMKYENLKKTA